MNQKRMDQLIVQAKRRHRAKMERLRVAFLGKRAELEKEIAPDDLAEEAYGV